MPGTGFNKSLRLVRSSDFSRVFAHAPLRATHKYFLILARPNDLGHPRLGLIAAKKKLRKAVERNRFKRLVRESFRKNQDILPSIDAIVLAHKDAAGANSRDIARALDKQWRFLIKKSESQKNDATPST